MIEEFKINFDTNKLKKIAKAWAKNPWVKVGILEDKDDKRKKATWNKKKNSYSLKKTDEGKSNTEIAFAHEFGSRGRYGNLPERSFLRMPIRDDFQKVWNQYAKTPNAAEDFVNNPKKFLNMVGELAVQVVDDAFQNGGSSQHKWPALKDSTLAKKKVNQILVETGQLRDSISYEIVNEGDK